MSPIQRLRRGTFACALAFALTLGAGVASAATLTVYSSADADLLKAIAEAFGKDHPAIKVEWVRDSTGIIQKRLLAEKDKPQADVVFAHTAASMVALAQAGLLSAYAPKGVDKLNGRYLEKRDPPQWVGLYAWASAICFNSEAARKAGASRPARWTDLTQPAWAGKLVMPNPQTSGTGALMVNGWIQMWGEEKAWAFMDQLHRNISVYSTSGSKPCEQAASGDAVAGLSLPARGAELKTRGAPIEVVLAEEGTGWDMQAVGIVKGTRNLKDAQTLADWAVSSAAMEVYGRSREATALRVRVQKAANMPANVTEKMVKMDFEWVAKEQPRILAEWARRYGAKAEPAKP